MNHTDSGSPLTPDIESLRHIAYLLRWGYVFTIFNLNLGTLNLLPDWLGYLFFLFAVRELAEIVHSAGLLYPLAWILMLWEAAEWLVTLFGGEITLPFIGLLAAVISLYFTFQLLTDFADAIAPFVSLADRLRLLRNILTVLTTLLTVMSCFPALLESTTILTVSLMLVNLGCAVWICLLMSGIRGELADWQQDAPADDNEDLP